MAETKDKVVGEVYESFDYDKFKILSENRGQRESKGIKEKKLQKLQKLINDGEWIHEISRVLVNEKFEIVDGAHTLTICKANGFPVRYEITTDPHFNDTPKRDLIGAVYNINSVNTTWTSSDLFNAAVQTKAPLALPMKEIIEANDNYFVWTDLMALLEKNSNYFLGRWREHCNMKCFEKKDLVEYISSPAFDAEVKYFAKFNLKARIAFRKGIVLKSAYDILWNARDMVDPKLFRKALASIPETAIQSQRATAEEPCARMLLQHYNRSQGQQVETGAVLFALKHKGQEVLQIE